MSSPTFYLKYRPQNLSDLTGQETVKKNLTAAYQNQKLSHAYLFVGPRGTGKTSTARILAKMVNCESQVTSDYPCNKCSTCLSITDGSNLDLIEIDAASNRGIEDIRSLKETIKLSPTGGRKKVYIIDEVHMLTQEAFNALLKTLEEPPSHALFILATTEVSKVPKTIISRVQRLDFSLAKPADLKAVLEKIVKAEKIDIEPQALDIIAKEADGSFRDAVKLLDQFAFGGKITGKEILDSLKSSGFDELIVLLKNLNARCASESLLQISNMLQNGADVKGLTLSLMDLMRDLMLIKNELGSVLVEPKYTSDKYASLLELAGNFSLKDLAAGLNIFQEALTKLKFTSIPSLPLELAVVEICGEQMVDDGKSKIVVEDKQSLRSGDLRKLKMDNPSSNSESSDDILRLKEKWNFVLETIRPYNFSLEALLRSVSVTECNEKTIIIQVPYSFHQRILEAPKNRDLLESIFSEILGRNITLAIVLGNRPARREDIANIEVAADDEIIRVAAEIFNSEPVN